VADWVDAEILACEHVEGPLLELTTLRDKSEHTIVWELRALSDAHSGVEAHGEIEAHLVVACLGVMVEAGRIDLATAISRLCTLTVDTDDLTADERSTVFRLDDGYDLAASETHGTLDQVRADFLAFTSRYRHLLAGVR
jgi:hypothetical protein